jgi:hypothetical protein
MKKQQSFIRSDALMTVKISILVSWVVMPCGLVDSTRVSEKHSALKMETICFLDSDIYLQVHMALQTRTIPTSKALFLILAEGDNNNTNQVAGSTCYHMNYMHPTPHLHVHYMSSMEVLYVDSITSASYLHHMLSSRSHQLEHTYKHNECHTTTPL